MAEEQKTATTETATETTAKTTETATAAVTTDTTAKTDVKAVDTKSAETVKTETKVSETPAEELKTLLDEADKEEGKEGDEKVAKVVPEKYEFKIPEGLTIDEASLPIVESAFKELGLDNEQAQKLVDLQAQLTKAGEEAHVTQWNQHVEDLKKESKEYFGTKLPEVLKNVARARDLLIPKNDKGEVHPLQTKINVSGLANDKDYLEFMDRIGRLVGEGKFVNGKRSGAPVLNSTEGAATLAGIYETQKTT